MSLINADGQPEINIDKNGNRILKSINKDNNCTQFKQFKSNDFVLDEQTKFLNDQCFDEGERKQNNNINDYMLSNYSGCDCKLDNVIDIANKNRGITIKDGHGISNCNIDDDSVLRIGNVERHYKSTQQLFPRPFMTSPFILRGEPKPDIESRILSSIQNVRHGQMQNFNEENVYTPLNDALAANVQNPIHIIPELVSNTWVRGGLSTRQIVQDNDYQQRTTDSDVVKNLLLQKKPYLRQP